MAHEDPQTVARMAIAMMCADKDSPLARYERAHYVTRLQVVDTHGTHIPLSPEEIQHVLPLLLAWADARRESFGQVLRRLLLREEPEPYYRHGEQLALADAHHRSVADQAPASIPLHRRPTRYASTRRKG